MGSVPPRVKEIIDRHVAALRREGVDPTRVVLFGSQARGDAHEWSDIDILVVSPAFERLPPPECPKVLARANEELFAPIGVLWATPAEIENASPSFLREVLRSGIDMPLGRPVATSHPHA